jgi:hypothetical protein
MKPIRITYEEFIRFIRLQRKKRWDWPATFSTNPQGEIWPYVTKGLTPENDRDFVQGELDLLDQVAGIYSELREAAGRFHIDWDGAYGCFGGLEPERFIVWRPPLNRSEIDAETAVTPTGTEVQERSTKPITYPELMEKVWGR